MSRDELLLDKEHAKLKGFDNVFDWYLACLNAEVNILLDPKLRTADRLDKLASQAKIYIEKLAKAKQHYEQKRLDRPELRKQLIEWLYNELSIDSLLKDDTPEGRERWVNEEIGKLLALIPDIEELEKRIKKQAADTIKGIEEMYEKDEANVIEKAKKQLIPDGWGNVGINYRLYPGGVECVVTYITEAGFEESKGFAKAPKDKVENYDRQKLAKEALRQALKGGTDDKA